MSKNNNTSLFDSVKADAIAADKTAAHYLTQAQQRAALTRLPRFEHKTTDDIARLQRVADRVYRMLVIAVVFMIALVVIGGVICLL